MKKVFFIISLLGISFCVFGQKTTLSGVVVDAKTNDALSFATIKTDTGITKLTDSRGKFVIQSNDLIKSIIVSYVGYKSKKIDVRKSFMKIKMTTSVEKLEEVIITAKSNPALELIKKVVANKNKNDIEKALKSFKFNTYNKMLVTANPDSIAPTIDSLFIKKNGKKVFKKLDSTNYEFHKEIKDKHLYISEKISEIKFQKGKKRKEKILASRMAGFKNPIYEIVALTLQDFSVYDDEYIIVGTKYLNPVSKKGLKFYRYKILDTVTKSDRKLISIHFKPKKKEEKTLLEGVLYVDNRSFGIAKSIYELKSSIDVKVLQGFVFQKDNQIWFPIKQSLSIKNGKKKGNVKFFEGEIQISTEKKKNSIVRKKKNTPNDVICFISNTYNSNIYINKPVKIENSSVTIDYSGLTNKNQNFWNKFRKDSLTNRDKKAYIFVDSIGKKEKIEDKIYLIRKLVCGYYPTKYVDIDLKELLKYNRYEGLRLGIGGVTNENVSKNVKFSSYVAYGFKDHSWKHRHKIGVLLNQKKRTWLIAGYINDLKEAGLFSFGNQGQSLFDLDLSEINVSHFFNYKTFEVQLQHDIQPNLEMATSFNFSTETPLLSYGFQKNNFKINYWKADFSYSPSNEYMLTPFGKTTIKDGYPKLLIHTEKAFGDFSFFKINTQISHRIEWNRKSSTFLTMQGGFIKGKAPLTHLYSSNPNYNFENPYINRVDFEGKTRFETMAWGEFFSNKFVSLHLEHYLYPKFSLVTRGVFGTNSEFQNVPYKSLEKGYFESGFKAYSLFSGFGLSCFYRYGYYQNPQWHDNLAVKINYKIDLKF